MRAHPICWRKDHYEHHDCRRPNGHHCIEDGCEEPAGTLWGPYWCPEHDVERLDRVYRGILRLVDR